MNNGTAVFIIALSSDLMTKNVWQAVSKFEQVCRINNPHSYFVHTSMCSSFRSTSWATSSYNTNLIQLFIMSHFVKPWSLSLIRGQLVTTKSAGFAILRQPTWYFRMKMFIPIFVYSLFTWKIGKGSSIKYVRTEGVGTGLEVWANAYW